MIKQKSAEAILPAKIIFDLLFYDSVILFLSLVAFAHVRTIIFCGMTAVSLVVVSVLFSTLKASVFVPPSPISMKAFAHAAKDS